MVARKRFETHELHRIPVLVTEDAREAIAVSSAEGRLVAQALSEAFGQHPHVQAVQLSLVEKREHFRVAAEEYEYTGTAPLLLLVDVHAKRQRYPRYRYYVNLTDLHQVAPGTAQGFRAASFAAELLSLYPYRWEDD
jgi:hypothetical protein